MRKVDVVRAWKDPVYRSTLTAEELTQLPVHPSGVQDLRDEQLKEVTGAPLTTATIYTYANWRQCCP